MSESTSANPDDLNQLVTNWTAKSPGLWSEIDRLMKAEAAVVSKSDMTAATSNALPGGSQVLNAWDVNTKYVAVVEAALRHADQWDGEVATVSGEAIDQILAANQVSAPAGKVEVPPSEFAGMPVTSGYVDDPICAANGNFVHVEDDLYFPGWAALLDVTRTYNSVAVPAAWSRTGAFGPGWTSLVDVRIGLPAEGSEGPPLVHLADGAVIEVLDDGTGRLRPRGARHQWLERTAEGWSLHASPTRALQFDEDGRFVGVTSGVATLVVERDDEDRVVRLAERRSGRWVQYEWADDRVVAVRTSDGRQVAYRYDDHGVLVAVDRASGGMSYEVDGAMIVSVTDADGVRLAHNEYDGGGRVLAQTNELGRTTTYEYSEHGTTLVADTIDGPRNALVHDARGNLTALVDGLGRTMRLTYDDQCRATRIVNRDGTEVLQAFDEDGNIVERVDPDGLATRWTWDSHGRLLTETHRNGETTTYEYEGDHRQPSRIVEPGGATVTIEVTADDKPCRITDADSVFHDFEWDDDGQLVGIVDGLGNRVTLAYDAAGLPTGGTDGSGVEIVLDNDADGRLVRSVIGDASTHLTWSAGGRATSATDPVGVGWTATWGDHGRLHEFTDAEGSTVTYDWDRFSNLACVTAPDGARYEHTYDPVGNLVGLTDPAGNTAIREYDADGRAVAVIDPAGRRTDIERDAMGRAARATAPDGTVTGWTYHPMGGVEQMTNPDGTTVTSEVDDHGRVTAVTDEMGNRFELGYSRAGRLIERHHPTGHVERWEHDAAGRVVGLAWVDADGNETERVDLELDGSGRVLAADAPEGRTTYTYAFGSLIAADGPVRSDRFELDAAGRIVAAVDGEGGRTTYDWDRRGQLAAATDPAGGTAAFGYDVRGLLSSVQAANGDVTSFGHDRLGRHVSTTDPTGAVVSARVDAFGAVLGQTTPTGADLTHTLDAAGRPTAVAADGRTVAEYRYDASGRLVQATDTRTGARTSLGWDRTGRLADVTGPNASLSIGHDRDGTVDQWTLDGLTTRVRRDGSGRVDGYDDAVAGGVDGPSVGERATRDRAGRITADGRGGTYRYDVAGRLVEALGRAGVGRSFAYGDDGLLASETGPDGDVRYHRGFLGRVERVDHADGPSTTFGYDAAGRRTTADRSDGSSVRYRWDELGRLVAVERAAADGSVARTDVGLDGLGRPAWIGSTPVVWDDALSGRPARIGSTRYLHLGGRYRAIGDDHDADGDVDAGWSAPSADPWGSPGPDEPHLGFGGHLAALGLVWMGERVYDPAVREFLSPDPLLAVPGRPGHAGVYSYGFLDPVNHVDPDGRQPITKEAYDEILKRDSQTVWASAWDHIKEDPLGSLAMVGVVAVGVTLCATGVGGPAGAAILIGAGAAAAQGLATKNFNPRTVAVTGAVSGLTAGIGDKIMAGASLTVRSATVMGAADGGGIYLADSAINGRPITSEGLVTSVAFGAGGGMAGYGASQLASKIPLRVGGAEPEYVNLASPQRTAHILDGDATGGGHLWPGQPGKTPFPQDWSRGRIMHEVSDIATDPSLEWRWTKGAPGSDFTRAGDASRVAVTGVRGGVPIKVVIEPAGEGIITAHPVPTP